jgi:hypothetical protein
MDNADTKQILIQRAELAEELAGRMKNEYAKETMHALAWLYRDLARQVDKLAELQQKARRLFH